MSIVLTIHLNSHVIWNLWVNDQHDNNATQVPPEWHSWLMHIRKDPPTQDPVIQAMTPPWKAVCDVVTIIATII
jgi:NADH:ubiquinone oxidoreductase subunit